MYREADDLNDLNDLNDLKVPKVLNDFKVLREYSAVCFLRRPFRPLFVSRSAAPLSAPRKEIF